MPRARWKTKSTTKPRIKKINACEALLLSMGINYVLHKEGKGRYKNVVKVSTNYDSFDSMLECYFYYRLVQEQIPFCFQVGVVLQEAIKIPKQNWLVQNGRTKRTISAITLTPDFVCVKGDMLYVIDTKGKQQEDNKIKFKLLEAMLIQHVPKYKILLPQSEKEVEEVIRTLQNV